MCYFSAKEFFKYGSGIVTLCGSTRFFFEFIEVNRVLTFYNWIVFLPGSFGKSFHKYTENQEQDFSTVKELHYHKIMRSDCIVVVTDTTRYVGESTKAEINFARGRHLPVFYYNGLKLFGKSKIFPPCELKDNDYIKQYLANQIDEERRRTHNT